MNKLYLIIASTLWALTIAAQQHYGNVHDTKNTPIEFVNIVLFNANDTSFIAGAVSGADGSFTINAQNITADTPILIRASCLGYKTVYKKYTTTPINITMQESAFELGETVVKGKAPSYKLTGEGITTNVAGTMLAELGSGDDVLKHVPGVIKDGDAYNVFGKGTPLIYINGRRVFNNSDIDELKSENIKSVEVITSPGAKYDAEVKSVIKITTKKPVGEGFGISLRSSYYQGQNADLTEQIGWNYRKKNFDLFGFHSFVKQKNQQESNLTQTVMADTIWKQKNQQTNKSNNVSFKNTLGANYQLGKNSSIGIKYVITTQPTLHEWNSIKTEVTADDDLYDNLNSKAQGTEKHNPEHALNTYYHGQLGNVKLNFDVDYIYKKEKNKATVDEISQTQDSRVVNTYGLTRNRLFASKFTADFNILNYAVTIGAEYTSSQRDNSYKNPEAYVNSSENVMKEQHISPFAECQWTLPIGMLTAGLRYEYVWTDYYKDGTHSNEQSRNYGNLYPNISFATQFGKTQMQLSYTAKTSRPSYSKLDGSIFYGNRFTYQGGNPLLKEETIHSVSFQLVRDFFQLAANFDDRRNAIMYESEMYNSSSSISFYSYKNLKSLKSFSLMAALSPAFGFWTPQLSIGIKKQWLNIETKNGTVRMNNPVAMFSLSNYFKLGNGWNALIDISSTTEGDQENCHLSKAVFNADASVSKSFFKKKLSIRIGAYDIFHTQKSSNKMILYQTSTTQTAWSDSQEVYVTLRYNFNTTKSKYKGTGAGNSEKNRM